MILFTGASSGIGKQTAIEFAKLGANIVLVARRKDKLEQVANELEEFHVSTLCLLYTSPSPRDVEESRMPSSA